MNNYCGKRPGAGRPFGSKTKKTLKKEAAREVVRQQVTAELEPLLHRQTAAAIGDSSVFVQDALTGRWRLIAAEDEITPAERAAGRYLRVFTKDPSSQAFAQLLDRALDK